MKLIQKEFSDSDLASFLEETLQMGVIDSVDSMRSDAFNSDVYFITVKYKNKTDVNAPEKLVYKRNKEHDGANEVHFYSVIKALSPVLEMVPTCYFSEYDQETGESVCLLQDVSDTHCAAVDNTHNIRGESHIEPSSWESILRTLAIFQAHWWESPSIGTSHSSFPIRPWYCDEAAFQKHIERRKNEYQIFKSQVEDYCSETEIEILDETLSILPSLWKHYMAGRISEKKNITLSQGDCFIGQFLVPKAPDCTLAMLVDFQEVSANFPTFDLGYLLSFFPPVNHADTVSSLKKYYTYLDAKVSERYAFNDLMDDYRLMLCLLIYIPVWDQSYGAPETYWKPKFRNVMRDFQNFECMEFMQFLK